MSICELDCCKECEKFEECGGCEKCGGKPFGGRCIAAEIIQSEGMSGFEKLKKDLIEEINIIEIPDLFVKELNLLQGSYVNLAYPLFNGTSVKFLKDEDIYLGNQIERSNSEKCLGVIASRGFILVCEYGENGEDPQLLMYKRRHF